MNHPRQEAYPKLSELSLRKYLSRLEKSLDLKDRRLNDCEEKIKRLESRLAALEKAQAVQQ